MAVVLDESFAVPFDEPARDVADVIALVAVLGEVRRASELFEVPAPYRGGEDLHLPAGVVEVVLALHAVPRPLEEPGESVAEDGVAAVTDGERPGRVCAHELDLNDSATTHRQHAECRVVAQRSRLFVPEAG